MERQNANAARGFAAREKVLAEREKGLIAREVKVSGGGYEARKFVNVATEVIGLGLAYFVRIFVTTYVYRRHLRSRGIGAMGQTTLNAPAFQVSKFE